MLAVVSQLKITLDQTTMNPSIKKLTVIKEAENRNKTSIEQLDKIQRQISNYNKSSTNKFVNPISQLGEKFNDSLIFERFMNFNHYYPLNNCEMVLKSYLHTQKSFGKKKNVLPASPNYSFYVSTIRKGQKLRRMYEEQVKKDARAKRSSKYTKPSQFS